MRTLVLSVTIAVLSFSQAAEARKLSMMEWMDPKSMSIWHELTPAEKTESIKDFIVENQGLPAGKGGSDAFMGKVQACLDKESNDPDYKDTTVPLMVPMSYCVTKYMTIMESKSE